VTLCLVTDRRRLGAARTLLELVERAVDAGVDLIQIRERDMEAAALASLVTRAVALARGSATRIVVNDRLDVALACGAGGVHLRGDSIPVAAARRLVRSAEAFALRTETEAVGATRAETDAVGALRAETDTPGARQSEGEAFRRAFLVGKSVHSVDEARAARGADYLIAGTVFRTVSKDAGQPLIGVAGLRTIVQAAAAPVLAIGGITREHLAEVAATGAAGIAAIGLFTAAPLADVVAEARRRFDTARSAP
jgi:thiamine-phosphate pyrophosphorylase